MSNPRVYNLESPRTSKPVANQFVINMTNHEFFQSYDSVIAMRNKATGKVTLDPDYWDYSVTTLKYLKQFLGGYSPLSKASIQANIDNGTFKTAKLN